MKNQKILDKIISAFDCDTFVKIEGHDNAVIGVDLNSMKLIYSVTKIIENLCNSMSRNDAENYFEENIACDNLTDKSPIMCEDYL